jgi:hypothetical protein
LPSERIIEFMWNASLTVRNVVIDAPISFDGVEIVTHPKSSKDSPRLSVTYSFTTSAHNIDGQTKAKQDIQKFLDVEVCNDALLGLDVREIIEEFNVMLENWLELQKSGMNPPTKMSFEFKNTPTWTKEYIEWAWDWSKKLAAHKDAEVLFRVLRLLRHSMLESDEYDRLSKVWRSFNALYNEIAGDTERSETNRIKNFARTLSATNSNWLFKAIDQWWTPLPKSITDHITFILLSGNYVNVMDCLTKQNFMDRNGVNYSQLLASAVSERHSARALQNTLLCIYCERNRVLHGEVISDQERDLLYICAAVLQRIVAIGLNEFYFIPLGAAQKTA